MLSWPGFAKPHRVLIKRADLPYDARGLFPFLRFTFTPEQSLDQWNTISMEALYLEVVYIEILLSFRRTKATVPLVMTVVKACGPFIPSEHCTERIARANSFRLKCHSTSPQVY